ncbi:MAG TPA: hypothetical protein VK968_03935, partial [Roseimicrobium sp.]|nr:hypothetical protein [Roseimicrobium sp.]
MKTHAAFPRSQRGSVLIVAMLLAAIIGVSLVSYLKMSNNALNLAQRTFYSNSAMNLAEIGLEEAISRFNALDEAASAAAAWPSPWTRNDATGTYGPYAVNEFTGFTMGPNTTGSVKVYVKNYAGLAGATPIIVAKSTITPPSGPPISKYIEVTLRKRSLFANGLVARNNISWVGHPSADSWDSDPDQDGNHVAYPGSGITANVVVGSIDGDIGLAGGEVWGYAKTGISGTITGGSVHPLGTSTDDPTRRTNDFNATFPEPTVPNPTTFNTKSSDINNTTTLPEAGDNSVIVAGVETYYYKFTGTQAVSLAGTKTLTIAAGKNVVFLANNSNNTTDAISVTGNAGVNVEAGATWNVYSNGNVKIAGNGFGNANNDASSTIFWGTNTTSQTIDVSG